MKKILSCVLVFCCIFTCLLPISVSAVSAEELHPQHLVKDFENGFNVSETAKLNGTAEWVAGGANGSKGAINFSGKNNWPAVAFPIRTVVGNTYHLSVWIKVNAEPKNQKASFIIYNNRIDGEAGTPWNQFTAHHTEDFQVGKWVQCTATFTPTGMGSFSGGIQLPVTENGTVEFRLGTGVPQDDMGEYVTYSIDDFYVLPETQPVQETGKELITDGGFATEESFLSNWQANSKASTVTYLAEGANGTAGAAQVEVKNTWGTIRTAETLDLQYFKRYHLTYWAKAVSENAIGKDIFTYIDFSSRTDETVPKYTHIYPNGENETLSTEWQKYESDVMLAVPSDEVVRSALYFRAGDGKEAMTYAVDEVSLVQAEDFQNDMIFEVQQPLNNQGECVLTPVYTASCGGYGYHLVKKEGDTTTHLASGNGVKEGFSLSKSDFNNPNLYIEYVSWDAFYNYSPYRSVLLSDLGKKSTIAPTYFADVSTENCFWNEHTGELWANITLEHNEQDTPLLIVAAQYDAKGQLLEVKTEQHTVFKGESHYTTKTIQANKNANAAKFLLWNAETLMPLAQQATVAKITGAEYIYVNAQGANGNGSFEAPFNCLDAVQTALTEKAKANGSTPLYVVFYPGEYVANAPIALSGSGMASGKQITFTSATKEKAKITGAHHVTGFELFDTEKGIYRAQVPAGTQSRQLFVNGIKATRARTIEDPVGFENLDHGVYNAENMPKFYNYGLTTTDTSYLDIAYPNETELVFVENWRHYYIMPDTVTQQEDGKVHFGFDKDKNAGAWMAMARSNTEATIPAYLENSLTFLDEEGEWYLDTHENYLYYKPRSFENIHTADVVLPVKEKLVKFTGTVAKPVSNVSFYNLDFQYTTWNHVTNFRSFVNGQNATHNGNVVRDGFTYTGYKTGDGGVLVDSAVDLKNIKNITIDNCDFKYLGSTALKMTGAVQDSKVIGNEFYEISAIGIALGDVTSTDWNVRYPDFDEQKIRNNVISNNYIHKFATDYHSAAGLSTGFVTDTVISHNELCDGCYSGMHIGWGWGATTPVVTENLVIENNYIHDVLNYRLYDGGGVYMLGNTNGENGTYCKLTNNYFNNINNGWGAIYPDEGSSFWEISGNVVDLTKGNIAYKTYRQNTSVKTNDDGTVATVKELPDKNYWLHVWTSSIHDILAHDNYSTTASFRNGGTDVKVEKTTVIADGNWSGEAKETVKNAGVERKYQNRFTFQTEALQLPLTVQIAVGETKDISLGCRIFPKEKPLDLKDAEVNITSNRPDVVTVSNNALVGKSKGMAWVTVSVLKRNGNEITFYDEYTFCVYVS